MLRNVCSATSAKNLLKIQFRISKYINTIFLPMGLCYFKITSEVIEIWSMHNLYLPFHPIYLLYKDDIPEYERSWGIGRLPGNAQTDHKGSFLFSHSYYDSLKDSIVFTSPPSSSMKSVSTEPEYLPWENKTTKRKKLFWKILESKAQKHNHV